MVSALLCHLEICFRPHAVNGIQNNRDHRELDPKMNKDAPGNDSRALLPAVLIAFVASLQICR